MRIGIDASRAFLNRRTGIEEYSYQLIRHLRGELTDTSVTLYVRKKLSVRKGRITFEFPMIDFDLPPKWRVKGIWAPRFWTQVGLSFEMFQSAPDVLFVPAHTVPCIHPSHTIVTVHGLEYEFSTESYGFWERLYMRWSIRYSVHSAAWVIAVSENTKRDLMRLYRVAEERIRVVYEGCGQGGEETVRGGEENRKRETIPPLTAYTQPYLLFIGRLETRKNIVRMIEAFERFKEKTGLPHVLVLAGKPGFGYEKIKDQISKSTYQKAIQEVGYVSESEKWQLLRGADVFLFPSLYEGFGLPVIEAQSVGVPVITSETSSLPEIAGEGALFVDPFDPAALAQAMETLATDPEKRADIIEKATYNVSRFSWATCARRVASLLAKR